jgi:hypothetical protein
MGASSDFEHLPFEDAASQIRLLRFLGEGSDGSLMFDMHHYQLSAHTTSKQHDSSAIDRVPRYIAMSYTWGAAEKTHEVFIRGKRLKVGANCHYGLSQAIKLESYPAHEQHYWMDQISINQQDRNEKEKQVGNMGEVYRGASAVFASLGPHADGSDFLLNIINDLDIEAFETLPNPPPSHDRRQMVHQLLASRGHFDDDFEKLRAILTKFAIRPYWTRLWILQEMFLSVSTIVLCGNDSVPIHNLASFWDVVKYFGVRESFWTYQNLPETLQQLLNSKHGPGRDGVSLPDALKITVGLGCFDRRDSVYGIKAMVRWPADMPPLQVDYAMSASDLFWRMVPYVDAEDFSTGRQRAHWEPADIYMLLDVFNFPTKTELQARARRLASYRMLYRALHEENMDGASVRGLLQRWADDERSHIELPSAELLHAWQTALHPRPKSQKFRAFAEEWKSDPKAHIVAEQENYMWYGTPKEEDAKQHVATRLTGWRPESATEDPNKAGHDLSAIIAKLSKSS